MSKSIYKRKIIFLILINIKLLYNHFNFIIIKDNIVLYIVFDYYGNKIAIELEKTILIFSVALNINNKFVCALWCSFYNQKIIEW